MSKVITNENQLNTEVDDLVTENYALEVLGLKNPADFRKFSRSFMKLSKIVKGIDDSNVGKLDKGAVSSEYDTAKKIEDKIKLAQSTADNKVSKTGDTMTGTLTIKSDYANNCIIGLKSDVQKFVLGCDNENSFIYTPLNSRVINLNDNGNTTIKAKNLNTDSKEVVEAINELLENAQKINFKATDGSDITSENFKNPNFWRIRKNRVSYVQGDILGLPSSIYILTVKTGVDTTTLTAQDYNTGRCYTASINGKGDAFSGWYKQTFELFTETTAYTFPYPKGFNKNNCYISAVAKKTKTGEKEFLNVVYRRANLTPPYSSALLKESGIFVDGIADYEDSSFTKGVYVYITKL